MDTLELWSLAENLGSVESLVTHSVTMTHADMPREERIAAGITDGLVRLSAGLESAEDLIIDLKQALDGKTVKFDELKENDFSDLNLIPRYRRYVCYR